MEAKVRSSPEALAAPARPAASPPWRRFFAAYVIQFVIPAALLADSLLTRTHRALSRSEAAIGLTAALWLVVGLAAVIPLRKSKRGRRGAEAVLLCLYATFAALAAAEVGLRAYSAAQASQTSYYSYYSPSSRFTSIADPKLTPGASGRVNFTVNEMGLRGPSRRALEGHDKVYKIFTVGGSTTECPFLDDADEWPHLLMQELNAMQRGTFAYVGNAGVKGHTTAEHIAFLKSMRVLQDADVWVFLTGVNDFIAALAFDGGSTTADLNSRAAALTRPNLWVDPPSPYPLYQHLRIFQFSNVIRKRLGIGQAPETSNLFVELRRARLQSPVAPMPDLSVGLAEYRQRIAEMIRLCRASGKRCVFLTQPTMWRAGLTAEEERLLWFGWVGKSEAKKGYASAADLAAGMDLYNRALLETCRANGVECYDLAAAIPKDTSAFFDDCHFNRPGARRVSQFVADRLMSAPPFRRATPTGGAE